MNHLKNLELTITKQIIFIQQEIKSRYSKMGTIEKYIMGLLPSSELGDLYAFIGNPIVKLTNIVRALVGRR